MKRERLEKTFAEIKEAACLDYAIIDVDDWGDCTICVNDELSMTYGTSSKGIFLKHWTRGMNKGPSIETLKSVVINHDLTEEQGKKVIEILKSNGYKLESDVYDETKCFEIAE